jgi:hypothetical protein
MDHNQVPYVHDAVHFTAEVEVDRCGHGWFLRLLYNNY